MSPAFILLCCFLVLPAFTKAHLSDVPCGKTLTSRGLRIDGGSTVTIEDFPFQLSLSVPDFEDFCGAVLIMPTWALTTARCTHEADFYEYHMYITSNSTVVGHGVRTDLKTVVRHPKYNATTNHNNIALLEFTRPMECLYCKPVSLGVETPSAGDKITLSGWQRSADQWTDNCTDAVLLKAAEIPVVDPSVCGKAYPDYILENTFCASDDTKRPSWNNEGGPAILDGNLVGVFSMLSCSEYDGCPGIYTDVTRFTDWIEETVSDGTSRVN